MPLQNADSRCVLLLMTDGLEEIETVGILCRLRQAGLCVKSVGLTGGLVAGAHGILLKPDLTLADFESTVPDVRGAGMVILIEKKSRLGRLENEPRLHQLLRHTLCHGGCIALDRESQRMMRALELSADQLNTYRANDQILIHDWEQSFETFTSGLIRRFEALPQTRSHHRSVTNSSSSTEG